MRKMVNLCFLAILFVCSSCTSLPATPTTQPPTDTAAVTMVVPSATATSTSTPEPVAPTLETFKNIKITSSELRKEVQLSDGKWTETQADGSIQMITLDEHFALGDLNADGVDDAVVITAESMGGSGSFYSLIALVNENGTYVQKGSAFIDDRPLIHSLVILDGEIILEVTVHGLNDAMVSPTVNLIRINRLVADHLIPWRQTQKLSDGFVREINIETPVDYTDVNGEVTLTGGMPIAPFENTLLVQVIGLQSNQSFTSSIMVTAADVGMPATFTTSISLDKFPAGEVVIIQLVEVSMADGSHMAYDSVVLKIK